MKMRVVKVECRYQFVLFEYRKIGAGRLIKCYLPCILSDYVNLAKSIKIGTSVLCPRCSKRIGTIFGIKGTRAIKLNQGQVKPFRFD